MKCIHHQQSILGSALTLEIDGIEYEIKATDHSNVDTYATVIFKDGKTGDKSLCYGMTEANGHRFTFKWELSYNTNRDNWVTTDKLHVIVD